MVIYLHTPTAFSIGQKLISQPLTVHVVNVIKQTEILTAEPLVPYSCSSGVEIDIE
jgi:hypothetical protein